MTIIRNCRSNETKDLFSNYLLPVWSLIKRTATRYKQWVDMNHNQQLLLKMEDRMLNDIGLSRADAVRISKSNAHTFWKFVFRPESSDMKDQGTTRQM